MRIASEAGSSAGSGTRSMLGRQALPPECHLSSLYCEKADEPAHGRKGIQQKFRQVASGRDKRPGYFSASFSDGKGSSSMASRIGLPLPAWKSLQVLAYLLLVRAAPVSRDYLAFLLWPDGEGDSARSKLRASISGCRRCCHQPARDFIVVETDALAWQVPPGPPGAARRR